MGSNSVCSEIAFGLGFGLPSSAVAAPVMNAATHAAAAATAVRIRTRLVRAVCWCMGLLPWDEGATSRTDRPEFCFPQR